ncbi:substrate-binding periplasmic protein [Natronospira bacteriovora]|uniref:Transporter substrate-binding domain-containing protein n=1 Tax=Natronospira bacteriovora TaxID=3069753 RepID=A0ABU0W878_9GAMM|nr:transporter substrate-binding domain-containing protein [Natronospira sp. AB-CW4]MDQ2070239.1 transporter substrate-binding domain-containing protein [Natronospira sp. AB-CW4]
MSTRTTLSFLFLALLAALTAGCAEEAEQKGDYVEGAGDAPKTLDCQLTMGWDPWEPYQYLTPAGDVAGLDVELIKAAAHHAGCAIVFEQGDFVSLLQRLREGDVDFLPGATLTEARQQFAYFSQPYREETFSLWVRAEDQELFADASLASLLENRRRVGYTEGFIYGEEAERLMADPQYEALLVSARIGDLNLLRLIEHDIDALIEDPFVAASIQRRLGLSDQVVALDQVLESAEVRLMFSRESVDEETVERFNEGLERVIEDGTRDRVTARYRRD